MNPSIATDPAVENETSTRFRTCPLCEACCGLEITVKHDAAAGDQIVRIRGDRNDPHSQGFICPKGSTLKQLHEDPDRLTSPVVRDQSAGGTGWREVSWLEAFELIESRLTPIIEAHGRNAVATVLGNPNVHNLGGQLYLGGFLKALGSTQIYSASTVDQMPKHVTSGLMWGDPNMFPLPDIRRTDYLLMLGANPWVSNGSLATIPDWPGHLEKLVERGGSMVVVDPRRTRTAAHATEHLTITPGTDAVWLLAIINELFAAELVSLGRLQDHIAGVEDVKAAVAEFSPERAEATCGIDAATTRRIAHELAAAEHAVVYGRMGNHTVRFGSTASWAADVINALTGNLDAEGGVVFNGAPTTREPDGEPGGRGFTLGRWTSPVTGSPEIKGEFPAARLAEECEGSGDGTDKIRAMFLMACNPVRSFPNSQRLNQALGNLDLLVAVDPYINASSRHADVILPPLSALERSHYDMVFETNMIRSFARYSPPTLPPAAGAVDEPQILSQLALIALGFGAAADPALAHAQVLDAFLDRELASATSPIHGRDKDDILAELAQWNWAEQIIDLRLRVGRHGDGFGTNPDGLTLHKLANDHPSGIDFGPVPPRFPAGIQTESGRVELAPPSIIADIGLLAEADLAPPTDGLMLIGRRDLRSCNTWMGNVDVLVKGKEKCTLEVHPDDATRLHLTEGGQATITSRVGAVTAPVQVTTDVMPGVVCLPFGHGHDEAGIEMHVARSRPGVNSNRLTDDRIIDPLSGNAVLNGIPVTVTPA